ncbi:MAG TPA: DUF917 domain-containing protein, partial [Reyranellaceae bacterium]|nr:DUF917 domain-containing protein [Reyranellaceae bacterium]
MRRELSLEDIESLAVGAWILGTGGGGNPYLPLLNMRALYKEGHRAELMDPADLADDDLVGMAGGMGAPLVGQERLTDGRALSRAVELMERHLGRPFTALMSVEIGGGNGVRPLMAAALLKRPVVDADPMGRAYPEAQMSSFSIHGVEPGSLAAVDVRGLESIVHSVPSWKWAERIARKICIEYGSTATICKGRTGAQVKKWGIHGTTTKAMTIGQAVREAQRRHEDPVAALLAAEPGKLLHKGKVVDVARRTTDGYLRGVVGFEGMDNFRGQSLTINFQNEWILALCDGEPIAMSPDLICVLDSVSGEAVGSETIRYGQRVTVIALPSPAVYLTPGVSSMSG